jgi:hypothetical protein
MTQLNEGQLEWLQDPLNPNGFAALPIDRSAIGHIYRVFPSPRGGWEYIRNQGLTVGPLTVGSRHGDAPTADTAMAVLEADWFTIQRFGDWARYMADNPPPAEAGEAEGGMPDICDTPQGSATISDG